MLRLILTAFLMAGCVSITKLPPQQSAKAKEYMLQADTHYQTAIAKYNEVDQLLNELIKDVEEAIEYSLKEMKYITTYLKQNPKATAKQIVSTTWTYLEQFQKPLTAPEITQKQKIVILKKGEAKIAYRKATEFHNEAATIADIRYIGSTGLTNEDFFKAEGQRLKKSKANNNAWQMESQANKYLDLIYDHYQSKKLKVQKASEPLKILYYKFLSTKKEALINYKKAIEHLTEEIKYRRKEFERIKKRL